MASSLLVTLYSTPLYEETMRAMELAVAEIEESDPTNGLTIEASSGGIYIHGSDVADDLNPEESWMRLIANSMRPDEMVVMMISRIPLYSDSRATFYILTDGTVLTVELVTGILAGFLSFIKDQSGMNLPLEGLGFRDEDEDEDDEDGDFSENVEEF